MITVRKYMIPYPGTLFGLNLPKGAIFRACMIQPYMRMDGPHVWFEVDDSQPAETRQFEVVGTGQPILNVETEESIYLASFQIAAFVGHVYEIVPRQP